MLLLLYYYYYPWLSIKHFESTFHIFFAKNDLRMSIISTTFNDFECMLKKAD